MLFRGQGTSWHTEFVRLDFLHALNAGFHQATCIEKFRCAQWGPDQLQARNGNVFIVHRNRYRQRIRFGASTYSRRL